MCLTLRWLAKPFCGHSAGVLHTNYARANCLLVVSWLFRCPIDQPSLFLNHFSGNVVNKSRWQATFFLQSPSRESCKTILLAAQAFLRSSPRECFKQIVRTPAVSRLSRGCLGVPLASQACLQSSFWECCKNIPWPAIVCSHPRRSAVSKLCARRLSRGCFVVVSWLSRCPIGQPRFFLQSSPHSCCKTIPLAGQAFLQSSPRECCQQNVRAPSLFRTRSS